MMKVSKTFVLMGSTTAVLAILLSVIMVGVVAIGEPTQQFNKIFLDPIYRESMDEDVNYTYTLTVEPPDRISNVASAIVTFQVWHNPTVRYYIWVDGQLCNTESFLVHTTYANAGEGTIFFDCSNVIDHEGSYEVVLQPDDDTGTVSAWLDLVYENNPAGIADIFGTEYEIGDVGTVFLQLKDSQGLPVNDGSCIIDVYYPNQPNSTHANYLSNAPLLYLNNSNGLYYYDLTIPNVTGIYMISASCAYTFQQFWIYPSDSTTGSDRGVIYGAYTGDTVVLNNPNDYLYTACTSAVAGAGVKSCSANYTWNISEFGINESSITNIFYHYLGETSASATLNMSAWNYTSGSWYILPNYVMFSGLASSGYPTGINDYLGNSIIDSPQDFISSGGEIKLKLTSTLLQNYDQYDNWLALAIQTEDGVIIDVKGSGELHVEEHFTNLTGLVNDSIGNLSNLTAEDVWNYTERLLTNQTVAIYVGGTEYAEGEEAQYIVQILKETAAGTTPINNATCTLDAYYPNATISVSALNMTYISGSNGVYRGNKTIEYNGTGVFFIDVTCSDGVKTYHTAGTAHVSAWANRIMSLENLTAENVWNFPTRNLTYHPPFNYTPIFDYIDLLEGNMGANFTDMINRLSEINTTTQNTYTYVQGFENLSASDVWSYTNRTLTDYNFTEILDYLSGINQTTYAIRAFQLNELSDNLTQINLFLQDINDTVIDINETTNNTYDYLIGLMNLTAADVWNYTNRNLTYYEDTTNYTLIQGYVWNASGAVAVYDQLDDIEDNTDVIIVDIAAIQNTTDEIYNQTTEIWWLLWNLSIGNITVQADVNWTEGIEEGANISNPIVLESQFITFAAATSPGESITNEYCLDNTTLISEINTTKCLFGECFNMSDQLPLTCAYGCYQDKCNPEPIDKFLMIMGFFLFIIAVIVIIALAYNRWG